MMLHHEPGYYVPLSVAHIAGFDELVMLSDLDVG